MKSLLEQQKKLPKTPGVYLFKGAGDESSGIKNGAGKDAEGKGAKNKVLYVGKASVLRTRVASYLRDNVDAKTAQLVKRAVKIDYIQTDTALEALFLEAKLIQKFQPMYNIRQKDDKSNVYLVVTKEKFPRLEITRPTALHKFPIQKSFGPFRTKYELEQALKILRRIFPYHSDRRLDRPCFHYQLKLCPGPCAGAVDAKTYRKNIRNLTLIFEGKKTRILSRLKKEMQILSKAQEFEKAAAVRDTLAALGNLKDIQLKKQETIQWKMAGDLPPRLEAYDISTLGGDFSVGGMVVFTFGRKDPAEYRKFKIRRKELRSRVKRAGENGPDDTGMLREVLERRFNNDWPRPNVIFIDGGLTQIRAANEVLRTLGIKIPIVSAAKGPDRKGFKIFKTHKNLTVNRELLAEASAEAHRFAIRFHREVRGKGKLN